MRALYTAASGMEAQSINVEVIANNVANLRTTGYKKQSAYFQDLLYETVREAGASTSNNDTRVPEGLQIGSGVKTVSTRRTMTQGPISQTGGDLDLAIRGEGFFRIQMPDGSISYTRDGAFSLDRTGRIVNADGYVLDPGITVPQSATSIIIGANGQVQAKLPNQSEPQDVGRIQLTRFANPAGLSAIGNNLFVQTAASGDPTTSDPAVDGTGDLQQRYLEEANVNPVTEITSLISAQRAYEMNSRVISAADQMQSTTSQMFKG